MPSILAMDFWQKIGFLPKLCEKNKIKFIGPHYSILKKLEDKIETKKLQKIGIPILPMSEGSINSLKDLKKMDF
jgi:pyruvate carboxylase